MSPAEQIARARMAGHADGLAMLAKMRLALAVAEASHPPGNIFAAGERSGAPEGSAARITALAGPSRSDSISEVRR